MTTLTKIQPVEVQVNDAGDTMIADLIIENPQGKWYAVDLGHGDWDYLQNNGEYIPV